MERLITAHIRGDAEPRGYLVSWQAVTDVHIESYGTWWYPSLAHTHRLSHRTFDGAAGNCFTGTSGNGHPMYDVSPDDQRFVMLRIGDDQNTAASELILVENWAEELRER